ERSDEHEPEVGPEHEHGAMAEVDDLEHAEDQREADRDQRVDAAQDETVDRVLQEHGGGGRWRGRDPGAAPGSRPRCAAYILNLVGWYSTHLPSFTFVQNSSRTGRRSAS